MHFTESLLLYGSRMLSGMEAITKDLKVDDERSLLQQLLVDLRLPAIASLGFWRFLKSGLCGNCHGFQRVLLRITCRVLQMAKIIRTGFQTLETHPAELQLSTTI
jgi:hypothetical protein